MATRCEERTFYELSKRVFDVAASAGLLALLGPGMLAIYLLVRATSRGPGLFIQDRAGRGGRIFRMAKFRTMRADHVHDPDPAIVIGAGHPAVTPVGRLLRRFKLDELPQIFNVLAGDMSLVGPRPTVPQQVARYDEFRCRRLRVRPGITGLAQVHGGTALSWDERIEWDVCYVGRRGWGLDLKILCRTAAGLLGGARGRPRRLGEVFPDEARQVRKDAPEGREGGTSSL